MVFSSIEFLYFYLPAALALYYLSPKRFKNALLFLTGLVFYAFGEPLYVFVLIVSCLIDYSAGIVMDKYKDNRKVRRICLIGSVMMNLGLLGVFKYLSFAIQSLNFLLKMHIPDPALPLPIGISFFTFQSMSYTIDLYFGNIEVQKSFVDFSAYVTMFPQIVAGPIVRYRDVSHQLVSRSVSVSGVSEGISRFTRGLAKKVLLANSVGELWNQVKMSDYSTLPVLTAWLGIVGFTFQIYFDFSGYSDMAIGLGKMLGFEFPENFNKPYMSTSVRDFWRRWHITLGSWFRNYVYFPLGGSREGMAKTVRNLAIVWLLTGLWHGASLNFILWGAWFGILIIAERLFLGKILERIPEFISWLYTILAVIFGWVLFETDSLSSAWGYFGAMFGSGGSWFDVNSFWLFCEYSIGISLCVFFASDAPRNIRSAIEERLCAAGVKISIFELLEPIFTLILLVASTAYLVNGSYNPFLYFNF